jgi:hypothetical protein
MNYLYNSQGNRVLYLTPREFSAYYNRFSVTEQTVRNWMDQGMPHVELGDDVSDHCFIPAVAAVAWVREMAKRGLLRV